MSPQFSFFNLHLSRPLTPSFRRQWRRNGRDVLGDGNGISLPRETGFSLIQGKAVLVITDDQNLARSAHELGLVMSYGKLGGVLDQVARTVYRHVILAQEPGDKHRWNYLIQRGWTPHTTFLRTVATVRGAERKGNADLLMAFRIGLLVSRTSAEVILIGSGDGDLVEETAIGIRSLPTQRKIVTLSFQHATARRLWESSSNLIDGNIFIGLDCVRSSREFLAAA